jgi:acetate kinase
VTAAGHRVVHGGPKYSEPQRITAEMIEELHRLSPFDPEHLPEEILLTEAFHRRFPDLPQVACFGTAFHHDLPRVARLLPIPPFRPSICHYRNIRSRDRAVRHTQPYIRVALRS